MKISGYSYQDVARIIQSGSRIGQGIQTTAVVACGVGSDRRFPQALLQALREAGLETELHLWKTAVQVAEMGDVLSQDGARWRSGDHTKKLVLTVGPTGEIRRDDGRHTGQEVPTNQMALLGDGDDELNFRKQWPTAIRSFIDQNIYEKVVSYLKGSKNVQTKHVDQVRETLRILEGLTWGLFYPEPPEEIKPQELCEIDLQPLDIIVGERKTIKDNNGGNKTEIHFEEDNNNNNNRKRNILRNCFAINTGRDIRNIIRHFAVGENNEVTHLMVNKWIYEVDLISLYVFPVGKRLDENQDSTNFINKTKNCIINQMDKEKYGDVKGTTLFRVYTVMRAWQQIVVKNQKGADEFTAMAAAARDLNVLEEQEMEKFINDCREFVDTVKNQQNLPSASGSSQHQ